MTESLQFPGNGLLQGQAARQSMAIAWLTYMAAVRDVKAQVKSAYYQIQLNLALRSLIAENATINDLREARRRPKSAKE